MYRRHGLEASEAGGLGLGVQSLYTKLSDLLGLADHLMVLNVTIGKIATNLKCYTQVGSSTAKKNCRSMLLGPIDRGGRGGEKQALHEQPDSDSGLGGRSFYC